MVALIIPGGARSADRPSPHLTSPRIAQREAHKIGLARQAGFRHRALELAAHRFQRDAAFGRVFGERPTFGSAPASAPYGINHGLVDEQQPSKPFKYIFTVCHIDACGLEDGFMAGYPVSSMNTLFAAQPRMMRI